MPSPILLIAYDFHPFVGGGGAARMLKLAKYFHRAGRQVHVLTGGFETRNADSSLGKQIEGVTIHVASSAPVKPGLDDAVLRTRMKRWAGLLIRSIVPFPDNRFRFLPAMYHKAKWVIEQYDIEKTVVTSPPNTMSLLVPMLKRVFPNKVFVLDVRDMWALDPLLAPDNFFFRWEQRLLEKHTLRRADYIVSVTPGYHEWICKQLGSDTKATVITNGFDEEDFSINPLKPPEHGLTLGYAGAMGGLSGPHSVEPVCQALDVLLHRDPSVRDTLRIKLIGNCAYAEPIVHRYECKDMIELLGHLPHSKSLQALSGCHGLLHILFDLPLTDIIYPGKTFEYLRLMKPIVVLSRPGILRDLILGLGAGEAADIDNTEQIADAFERLISNREHLDQAYSLRVENYAPFERGALA